MNCGFEAAMREVYRLAGAARAERFLDLVQKEEVRNALWLELRQVLPRVAPRKLDS